MLGRRHDDRPRPQNGFYGALFGWEPHDQGEEAGHYTMYTLGGRNVAAASPPPQEGVPPHWTTYLASDDVDVTAAEVVENGGTVFMDPFDVFDSGRMTVAADPTGATFGIWQAGTHHGAELANEPGTLVWNDCRTTEPSRAADFYAAVFGHTVEGGEYAVLQVDGRGVAGVALAREGEPPAWLTVFACAQCDDTAAKARELGGDLVREPFDIPEVGRFAVVRDPVGAVFGVLSPPG